MHPLALRLKAQLAENPQQSATVMARFEAGIESLAARESSRSHLRTPMLFGDSVSFSVLA